MLKGCYLKYMVEMKCFLYIKMVIYHGVLISKEWQQLLLGNSNTPSQGDKGFTI
ncbi:hypothetical protein T479_23475 [Lysinibacillus varians]|nr:hypothetical protein T479_23475 [Lysinibacillus varians]